MNEPDLYPGAQIYVNGTAYWVSDIKDKMFLGDVSGLTLTLDPVDAEDEA